MTMKMRKTIRMKKSLRKRWLNMEVTMTKQHTLSKDLTTPTTMRVTERRSSSTESKDLSSTRQRKDKRLLPRSMLTRAHNNTRVTKMKVRKKIIRTDPQEFTGEGKLGQEALPTEEPEETEAEEVVTEVDMRDLTTTMKKEGNNMSREEVMTKEGAEGLEEAIEEEGEIVVSRQATTRATELETTTTMRENHTTRSITTRRSKRPSKQPIWLLMASK